MLAGPMHLLKIDESGALYDSDEAVDLGQPAGDICILTSADTEVSLLSAAAHHLADLGEAVDIRIANYLSLTHPYSVDLYIETTLRQARIVIVRLLGGSAYWEYGTQQLRQLAETTDTKVVFLSGDGKPDPELQYLSSLSAAECAQLSAYLDAGGSANALGFLRAVNDLLDGTQTAPPVRPLMRAGIYWPNSDVPDLAQLKRSWQAGAPVAAVVFYRALMQSGDMAPVDAMVTALQEAGLNPLPIFAASLKEAESAGVVAELLRDGAVDVIINMTSFAVSDPAAAGSMLPELRSVGPFGAVDAPVFQAVLASNRETDWQESDAGLTARDLAMNVALPELDGRILTRAIGFKRPLSKDPLTHAMTTNYVAVPERARFVAQLVVGWARLRRVENKSKKLALIMANYPNKDGRIANGVGLDTPESVFQALGDLAADGYDLSGLPTDSAALIATLRQGPTNAGWQGRDVHVTLPLEAYQAGFDKLPDSVRTAVTDQWGMPNQDPMYDGAAFRLPIITFGNAAVGVQPARGYNIDPKATYHSPDLVPPHNYFAFYIWLRDEFGIDAAVHFGKHGNLEWLPGKALALSSACFPEAVLGPVPHIYPFIVNDPGEGAQAKRRPEPPVLDVKTFRDPRNPETELAKTKRPADEESAPEGEIAKTDKQRGIGNGNKQEKRERRESQNGQRPGDETKRHPRKQTVAQCYAVQNFRLHDLIGRRTLIHGAASKSPTPLTTNISAMLKAGQCVVTM